MRLIAKAYTTKRECSIETAVYHIMLELWLRKIFSSVMDTKIHCKIVLENNFVKKKLITNFLTAQQKFYQVR